jgi:hypothetical protein
MKKKSLPWLRIAVLGLVASAQLASAQYFTNSGFGDLIAGFRKTGANEGNYELLANIGNITNLLALSPGTTVNVSNVTTGVLSDTFPTGNGNIQWSVFSAFHTSTTTWTNSYGIWPQTTVWFTVSPGTNTTTQTTPPARNSKNSQGALSTRMWSCAFDAEGLSSGMGVTNADNNLYVVREPTSDDNSGVDTTLDDYIAGDLNNPGLGDFGGDTINFSVECTNPASFMSPTRSDFYQACPYGGSTNSEDPITLQTNGNCYFVGYFLMNPNGTMTFTRAQTSSAPPPAPVLSISHSGSTATISFATTNGANYSLIYTTASGIKTPRSTWSTLGTSITGTGGTTNFTDTTSGGNRFYSVTAH